MWFAHRHPSQSSAPWLHPVCKARGHTKQATATAPARHRGPGKVCSTASSPQRYVDDQHIFLIRLLLLPLQREAKAHRHIRLPAPHKAQRGFSCSGHQKTTNSTTHDVLPFQQEA